MALSGLRVLEIGGYLTGPYAAMLLGDLGAEVIKIEPPTGDPFRGWEQDRYSPTFRSVNRNKRSLVLDLRADAARDVLDRLVRSADVLIENHRPGVAARLGFDYERLTVINPGLVHCAISGFGADGGDAPCYDTIGQAMGGLLGLLTDPRSPEPVGISLSDHVTGLFATIGVLAALHQRERTGVGQQVETSLLLATASFIQEAAARHLAGSGDEPRAHRAQAYAFNAGDDLPFVVHLSSPARFWSGLVAAIDRPELADDARFADRPSRIANYRTLHDLLVEVFATAPRSTWLERLAAHDVPAAPLNSIAEVFAEPAIAAAGWPVEMRHPSRGPVRLSGNPLGLDRTPVTYREPPPAMGEHGDRILGELGYDLAAIESLRREGVIG